MTKAQALEKIQAGEPLVFVEFRSASPDTIKWSDKSTGRAMVARRIVYNVEMGARSVQVTERLPDTVTEADLAKWAAPFKKGSMVLLQLSSLTQEKGLFRATGTFEAINN